MGWTDFESKFISARLEFYTEKLPPTIRSSRQSRLLMSKMETARAGTARISEFLPILHPGVGVQGAGRAREFVCHWPCQCRSPFGKEHGHSPWHAKTG